MKKDSPKQFKIESTDRIKTYIQNQSLQQAGRKFHREINQVKYAYNFFWLGLPIIQIPQDLYALQEIIWEVKPDLIIETGIARGGSLVFSASFLVLLESIGCIKKGDVIGIDIDIRSHNRQAISAHPLGKKITMIEGDSIDQKIIKQVSDFIQRHKKKRILVCLDSNHTHQHVLAELRAYTPLISVGSYCFVGDTGVEDLPAGSITDRPWGKGNNPKTAVREFLKENKSFEIDKQIENKLVITGSPEGYLKRIK